jgi:hypothetical protein
MGKYHKTDKLDAYGHLEWTVGNEDWIACFDAIRVGNKIKYHVVVDCDSGGFTDTPESGEVAATAEGIAPLLSLPGRWMDVFHEQSYQGNEHGRPQWAKTRDRWARHLRALVKLPRQPEPEGECWEDDDPVSMGWVGRDGRP